jgi:hypothetical protein
LQFCNNDERDWGFFLAFLAKIDQIASRQGAATMRKKARLYRGFFFYPPPRSGGAGTKRSVVEGASASQSISAAILVIASAASSIPYLKSFAAMRITGERC